METKSRLRLVDGRLIGKGRGESYAVGTFTLPSAAKLRVAAAAVHRPGRLRLGIVEGDVRALHWGIRQPRRAIPGRLVVQHAGDGRARG